jgi:hypothetical protein
MAVNTPNPGAYQQQLGQHAVALRDALQALLNDAAYINSMGGQTFLTGALGLAPADATTIMSTIGAVTPASTVVQQVQAFIVSTQPLWGGN